MTDQATHRLPAGLEIQQLLPQRGTREIELNAEREVLCIHRGTEPYDDMFNSVPFRILPGYFTVAYGAAKHFRDRAVVPGSRNPETHRQTSFLAIIGVVEIHSDGTFTVLRAVDHPDEWARFTVAEQAEYTGAVEALDRAGMVNAIVPAEELVIESVSGRKGGPPAPGKGSRIKGGSAATPGRRGATALEATDPALLQAIPAEHNSVLQEAQQNARLAEAEGHKAGR